MTNINKVSIDQPYEGGNDSSSIEFKVASKTTENSGIQARGKPKKFHKRSLYKNEEPDS